MKLTKKTVDALASSGRDQVYWDAEIKRFGLRVKPSGVKSFLIQYRNAQGRSRRHTIGEYGAWTPDAAREEAKQLLQLVDKGNDPAEQKQAERQAITISQLCDEYMEAARKGTVASASGKRKKASTLLNDASRISAHIRPLLGKQLVKDLTQAQTRVFYEEVVAGKSSKKSATDKKRGRSIVAGGPTAAKRCVGLLGGMLTFAVRRGYRLEGSNPARNLGMAADRRRAFRLEADGWRKLGEAIDAGVERGICWQAIRIVELLATSGCRLNEIASLRWAEVDFQGRCIRFQGGRVKSGELRPIGHAAFDILADLKKRADGKSPFVFPATRGSEDKAYSGIAKAWKRLGLDFTPHCLRHAFASAAEDDCGLHESTVAVLLGHSRRSANATRGYILKADATLLAAADKASRFISQAMTGKARPAEVVPLHAMC
ncbi:MAG: site-specific integrase [Rhodomicrobium sp.]